MTDPEFLGPLAVVWSMFGLAALVASVRGYRRGGPAGAHEAAGIYLVGCGYGTLVFAAIYAVGGG